MIGSRQTQDVDGVRLYFYEKLTGSKCFPIKSYERGLSVRLTKVSSVTYSHCNQTPIKQPLSIEGGCYKLTLVALRDHNSSPEFDKMASFVPHSS